MVNDPMRTIRVTVFDASTASRKWRHWQLWPARDQDADGKLWFATRDGSPGSIAAPAAQRPAAAVRIEQITADGKVYDAGSRALRLPARVRDLAIRLHA